MKNMGIRIALAGNPNSGKTTLFNALTGSNQFVGNWPGVTVEKKEGKLKKHSDVTIPCKRVILNRRDLIEEARTQQSDHVRAAVADDAALATAHSSSGRRISDKDLHQGHVRR